MIHRFAIAFLLCPLVCFAGLEWKQTELSVPAAVGQEKIEAVFEFTNAGDVPIKIIEATSSCGCTVPELEKDTYAPGETGTLKAVFTVGNRTGAQRKVITVTTDDPEQRSTQLLLETNIPELISIRPKMVLWRMDSESVQKEINLHTDPANKVTIVDDAGYLEQIKYELVASKETPGDYILLLSPVSTQERLQLQLPVEVELPDGKKSQFRIYVLVR